MGTKAKLVVIALLMTGIVGLLFWSKNGDRKKPVLPGELKASGADPATGREAVEPATGGADADPFHQIPSGNGAGTDNNSTEVASGGHGTETREPVQPEVRPDPPAPSAKTYTVVAGDSMWTIAKKVYGRGTEGHRIFEANKDKIQSEDDLLRVGLILTIPPLPEVAKAPVPETAEPTKKVAAKDPPAGGAKEVAAPAAGKTYKVQAGDTLSSIAKAIYGDASKWKAIYTANKDRLPHPDSLAEGQELVLPDAH